MDPRFPAPERTRNPAISAMKIISFKICPFVQRVTALLEAKSIKHEVEYIDLRYKPQWFLDISPHGQVPILITDERVALFESNAIVEYIEEAFPPLQPDVSLEEKAINRAWSHLAYKNYLVQCAAQRSPDRNVFSERLARLDEPFNRIEHRLSSARYFGGDEIGLVDIAWLPLLHRAHIVERLSGVDFLGNRPRLKVWQNTLLEDGLAVKSVAADFADAFSAFYFSNKTFLGRGEPWEKSCFVEAQATDNCCQGQNTIVRPCNGEALLRMRIDGGSPWPVDTIERQADIVPETSGNGNAGQSIRQTED